MSWLADTEKEVLSRAQFEKEIGIPNRKIKISNLISMHWQ